jgi:branched-chain amino acid transport system substrate-binding protein
MAIDSICVQLIVIDMSKTSCAAGGRTARVWPESERKNNCGVRSVTVGPAPMQRLPPARFFLTNDTPFAMPAMQQSNSIPSPAMSRANSLLFPHIREERPMNMLKRWLSKALVLSMAGWGTAAVAGPEGAPIKVGAVLPLTGAQQKFGEIEKNSFQMALEEINAAGGVNGRPIELRIEDDQSKIDIGRRAAEKLILQDTVLVLTGGYSSDVTFAIAAVAQYRMVPFLITTGAADEITELGADYVFRLNPPVSEYARPLIEFLQHVVNPEGVAILYEQSLFGQAGSREFADQAFELGWKIRMNAGYAPGTADFKPLLNQAMAAKPEVLYMIAYVKEAALLVQQSKELGFRSKVFAGAAAGFTLPEFRKLAGDAAENVFSVTLWTPQVHYPGAKEYYSNYMQRFGAETEYHGAEAYASLYVVADALKRAKELTPKGVRDALVKTNLMTAFGPVKFTSYDRKTQQNSLPTYLVQWQKGVLETVWPPIIATKAYVYND